MASSSKSRAALQAALAGAEPAGATTHLLDIHVLELPIYNPEGNEPTKSAAELVETCHAADGLLRSGPLYQGTIPARSRTRSTGCTCRATAIRRTFTTR